MQNYLPTNVLVVGSGGREHAIAWKLKQSNSVEKVYVAPGNGGTNEFNVAIKAEDIEGLSSFAAKNLCFTVVGPEGPLASGIVDHFMEKGLPIFGPSRKEALLESSKSYSKELMTKLGIPTAQFEVFDDSERAIDYAQKFDGKVAVKVDGLAAGKGVFVCNSITEAADAIKSILVDRVFGESGRKIVVEEKLSGRECSLMTICNGRIALPFGTAKDHKRVYDNDIGPNTGGMGAYSPADYIDQYAEHTIVERIANPVVRNSNFHGFLYLGLMLTEDGPKVLEFNARLGDPETQVILPRLQGDFFSAMKSMSEGNANFGLDWSDNHACTVVMCSQGYPQSPKTGDMISGLENVKKIKDVTVFHSGTSKSGNDYFTKGGRVLSVTGTGRTLPEAVSNSYSAVSCISWHGEHHRNDIGRV